MKMKSQLGLSLLLLTPFAFALPGVAQDNLVISEFMAVNSTNLTDDAGQYSDWIEIHNAGSARVNLEGWCLTDTTNNLTKWRFPVLGLDPYSYVVVFASGEDHTNAAAPLHTNFKLDAAGEFLGLVRPDGVTVVSRYAPRFPAQRADISYGLGMLPGPYSTLVPTGAVARFLVPTNDPGPDWTARLFDDSSWLAGPTGLGFDAGTNYARLIGTDLAAAMRSVSPSVCLRLPFTVTDPAQFQELKLRLRYDDGLIAYLNGTEVFRTNAPANATWNSTATAAHGSEPAVPGSTNTLPSGWPALEEFDLSRFLPLLVPGSNVLAFQGLNVAATNGDLLILPELAARAISLQTTSQLFFAQPTPGALNSAGFADLAPIARFSLPGGVYSSNLVVELTSPLSNAVIHYTLDGSVPSESSPLYTNALVLTNSASLRTKVYATGFYPSLPATEGYTLIESNLLSFSSELPLVILDTFDRSVSPDMNPKAPATLTIIDTASLSARATLLTSPDFHGRIGLEGRGQTSWSGYEDSTSPHPGIQKRPYNIEIRDENDQDQRASFLNFPAGSDFVLLNVYNDKSFLNDFMAYELFEKMGHYQVRRRYVEVFWNGTPPEGITDRSGKVGTNDYVGIYVLLEKIRIDPNRVNITPVGPQDTTEPAITGGYIWKKDKNSPGDVNFGTPDQPPNAGDALKYHDPRGEDLLPIQKFWLANHLTNFEAVLFGPAWRDPVHGYASYIDVDSFVDFHWIVEYSKQIDGYRLSSYFHKDRGGKIHWAPIWDWNLSFGNANYAQGGLTNGWYWTVISEQQHIWERRLIAEPGDPDYLQKLTDRWAELRQGVFHPSNVLARVDQITNLIAEATDRDFGRWPRLGRYLWPNPSAAGEGRDVNYVAPTNYAGIIQQWKNYIVMRTAWIDSQYLKAPTLSRSTGFPSAPLGLTAPAGTIYYTLDGSDPRLPGGYVAPQALVYSNFLTLPANARVCARAWLTNAWSAPAKADFGASAPILAVTEIMYHPDNPGGTVYGAEEFEYLELMNTTGETLDLTGVRLAGGVDFVFPAGPLVPAGGATTNDFDRAGTAYTPATLGAGPGPAVLSDGPAGSFLRLLSQDTGTNRNRVAFDQTVTGSYDRLTAEFDFRASNATVIPPDSYETATVQNFDETGTAYTIYPASGANIPTNMPADAGSQGRFLRITPEVGSVVNGVYFNQTATGVCNLVVAAFDFRITATSTPADGMGFALLNTANYGTTGLPSGLTGFGESPNFANSLGVGLDIYNNATPPSEPNDNHVSLHWNNAQVSTNPAIPGFRLVAGVFHRAVITIRFDAGNAVVSVLITPDVYHGGVPQTLFDRFVIPGVAAYNGRVAIGARTGGSYANQDIDNVNVQFAHSVFPAPGGFSLALLPAATYGATGQGTTLANYLDLPALSNTFGLNFDLHLLPEINYVNPFWNRVQRTNTYVPPAALDLDGGVFHHAKIQLDNSPDGFFATVTLTPDIFGTNGPTFLICSNQLIAGFYPTDLRLELAARSGGQNLNLDFDNVRVQWEKYLPNSLAAGARVLIVKNRAAFEARYGTGLPIGGEFVGQLNNAGDPLSLFGRYGQPIFDFNYHDWYPVTDGSGFSLVSVNPSSLSELWNRSEAWRVSTHPGGSPGVDDPPAPVFVPVVINEVLSHPDTNLTPGLMDAIELFNPSATESADLSHWYLTDDFAQPKKFPLPSPTIIPAGGFAVFYESDFGAPSLGANAFGLQAGGEAVYLFSADAEGNLTGYCHGFNFGASDPNVSFGRWVTSQGKELAVAQSALSLGATNPGPRVGPVVLSEVMYHPPDFPGAVDNPIHEFIELRNLTAQTVSLFDSADPAQTWHLRGGVDFHFPPGAQLAPFGYALVVNFDPVLEPELVESFRAQYALGDTTPLFGPYGGKLNNAGDNVELARPALLGTNSLQPSYVLVDKLEYGDSFPWPQAADGAGFSLQRLGLTQYGNDPTNWVAASPTPGAALVPTSRPVLLAQPTNLTVLASMPAVFGVTAEGDGPFRYQWWFNGTSLDGTTNQTLVLPNVQFAQAGTYQVTVLGPSTATDSAPAVLTVVQGATLLVGATNRSAWPGSNTTFSVQAIGNGPVTYRWAFNGVDLPNATNATLVLTNLRPPQAGDYVAWLRDSLGLVSAPAARLTVFTNPVFTTQPINRAVLIGGNATFSAVAFSSTPVRYQWRFFGTNLPGATASSLTINNVQLANGGEYTVVATDSYGSTVSSPATLIPSIRPVVTLQPVDVTARLGDPATLTVTASGTQPLYARWVRNGTDYLPYTRLPGDTAVLTLTNLLASHGGAWRVALTNPGIVSPAGVGSANAYITVVQTPVNPTVAPGGQISLQTMVWGQTPIRLAWQFDGTNLDGVTTINSTYTNVSTLLLSNVARSQAGLYTVFVTNISGLVVPFSFTMSVIDPPHLLQQPATLIVDPGAAAEFSVLAAGDEPLLYQWWFNDTNRLALATNASLTLNGVQASDVGSYKVVVSNPASSLSSTNARLWLSTLDRDGDGLKDWQEFIAGSDPLDPLSGLRLEIVPGTGFTNDLVLQFQALSNHAYSIISLPGWPALFPQTLTNVPPAATNRVVQVPDATTNAPARFYRLGVQPSP